MIEWYEWCEPFGPKDEPVYCRVSRETAIAVIKAKYQAEKKPLPTDEDALLDFIAVHWATKTTAPTTLMMDKDIGDR